MVRFLPLLLIALAGCGRSSADEPRDPFLDAYDAAQRVVIDDAADDPVDPPDAVCGCGCGREDCDCGGAATACDESHDLDRHRDEDGRPRLSVLFFHTDWCGPCNWFKQNVEPGLGVKLHRTNGDKWPDSVRDWNVGAYPTFILVREGSKPGEAVEIRRHVGAFGSAEQFHEAFPELAAGRN